MLRPRPSEWPAEGGRNERKGKTRIDGLLRFDHRKPHLNASCGAPLKAARTIWWEDKGGAGRLGEETTPPLFEGCGSG
jgi:hypothetical protein